MKKNITILTLIILSIFGLYKGLDYFINQQGSLEYPKAPQLNVQGLDQKVHEIGTYNDRLLIINFWASWCPPCLNELPMLIKVAEEFPQEITILAILTSDEVASGLKILNQYKTPLNFKFMVDVENGAAPFGTSKLPETYIIGKNREILEKISGDITSSRRDLRELIKKHLH